MKHSFIPFVRSDQEQLWICADILFDFFCLLSLIQHGVFLGFGYLDKLALREMIGLRLTCHYLSIE